MGRYVITREDKPGLMLESLTLESWFEMYTTKNTWTKKHYRGRNKHEL